MTQETGRTEDKGHLEAHAGKFKKRCSLSCGRHTQDRLGRADAYLSHFKLIFSGMELDIEKQWEEEVFSSSLQFRSTKCTMVASTLSQAFGPDILVLATRTARVKRTGDKETRSQGSSLT